MIHKLSIENFFSIAEHREISFKVPGNAPDLPCFVYSRAVPEDRLPVVIGFFGPNASGKSTILRALVAGASFIKESFGLPINAQIPLFQPYMHRDYWNKPTKIIVEFDGHLSESDNQESLFRYELHIKHSENQPAAAVSYEALSYAPKGKFRRLFERENQKITFGKEFGLTDNDPRIPSIRTNASVISTLAQLNHKPSIDLIFLIGSLQTNLWGMDKAQTRLPNLLAFYLRTPHYLETLNKELRRLDVGLDEMIIEQGNNGLFAKFKHIGLDGFIFMGEESMGTRRFIEIFPLLQFALETGSVAIVDELDTDLHPMLIPELFRWFSDPDRNKHKAQLLFTAHNPALLDDLEKEQVFLTEKTCGKPSCVYGARDIKGLRREPSLMKKYLAGELGAVPYIG